MKLGDPMPLAVRREIEMAVRQPVVELRVVRAMLERAKPLPR